MRKRNGNKPITLDDLAAITARGFEDVGGRLGKVEGRLDKMESRLSKVEKEVSGVKKEMSGLRASVNNYLKLSDKRYLELKNRQDIIISWIKLIAEKTKVNINFTKLEAMK